MSNSEIIGHKEALDKNKIKIIGLLTFFIGFGQAILIYIMSTYFKEASGTENVGVFYLFSYIFTLFVLFNLHKLVSSIGHSRVFLFIILAKIPFLAILAAAIPSLAGILSLMLYIAISNVAWVCLDMILESCSIDRMSGRIRGLQLTILSAGFLSGPFISTWILERWGFQGVFSVALILYSVIFVAAIIGLRDFHSPVERRSTACQLFLKVMKRKNILRIYYVSFVLEFFYALMVIFTPIYLRDLGFSWEQVGIIFTVMLAPFVIFQYPVGMLADKKMGEKELIIFSLVIMGIATLAAYYVNSVSILVWSVILFATRVGAAMLEILRDSYFYKRIDSQDIDLIDFFRTTRPTAHIIGAIFSTFFLFLFPLKTVFILVGIVALSAIIPAWKLADNKSERELNPIEVQP